MLEDQLLAIGWLYVALLLLVKQLPLEGRNSGVRSTPRASAREDMRRNFCAAANFKYQRGYRSRNSGVRSCRRCRIGEQGLYPKIQDQHLPGKILAKLPDSLAPELLQLLTPEFRNVLGGQAQVSEKLQQFSSLANQELKRLSGREQILSSNWLL